MASFLAIIPARYASTRFPGKPLADIGGISMIQRVYHRAANSMENVVVATDDERILSAVEQFGGKAVMTSSNHQSGTDRCAEALNIFETKNKKDIDIVINIQGDEPFIRRDQIFLLKNCFEDGATQIATLIKEIHNEVILEDPNRPKVVIDKYGFALFFSRSSIPYMRNIKKGEWHSAHVFYQHIGMYAYRSSILREITQLPQSKLEIAESLEQLRWLENNYKIKTAVTEYETFGIDTPEDLEEALKSGLL